MSDQMRQLVMPFAPKPSFAAADFIHGESNAEAYALVSRWPDWPYSLTLIHGPKGCGKTHLAHLFAARTQATFLSPDRIGSATADQLLVGNHCWVMDDVDAVTCEAALAQLINHARARGDYMLLLASNPVAAMGFALPDLLSRLRMLPAIALGAPDDALLMGVLAKAFADRQLRVTPELLHFAITHLERSYQAVQRCAETLDRLSLREGKAITIRMLRAALAERRL